MRIYPVVLSFAVLAILAIPGCQEPAPTLPLLSTTDPRPMEIMPRPRMLPAPPEPPAVPPPAQSAAVTAIMGLSAGELLAAADQARADAVGYVAWRQSKAENIEMLTDLTARLNGAAVLMRAGRATEGRYRASDVAAMRDALVRLRGFLTTKGD